VIQLGGPLVNSTQVTFYFEGINRLMKTFNRFLIESWVDPDALTDADAPFMEKLSRFLPYVKKELGIKEMPRIQVSNNLTPVREQRSMAWYVPYENRVWAFKGSRLAADVFRSIAHELVHHQQKERGEVLEGHLGAEHPLEQEANAKAGILLRNWGKQDATIYE